MDINNSAVSEFLPLLETNTHGCSVRIPVGFRFRSVYKFLRIDIDKLMGHQIYSRVVSCPYRREILTTDRCCAAFR